MNGNDLPSRGVDDSNDGMEGVRSSHEHSEGSNSAGSAARGVDRGDGGPVGPPEAPGPDRGAASLARRVGEHGEAAERGDGRSGDSYDPQLDPHAQPLEGLQFPGRKVEFSRSYQGPIPDHVSLAGYEQIEPGLAGRIVGMAERDADALNQARQTLVSAEAHAVRVSTWTFGVAPYALMSTTITLAVIDELNAAAISAIGTVLAFAPRIISSLRGQRSEPESEDAGRST